MNTNNEQNELEQLVQSIGNDPERLEAMLQNVKGSHNWLGIIFHYDVDGAKPSANVQVFTPMGAKLVRLDAGNQKERVTLEGGKTKVVADLHLDVAHHCLRYEVVLTLPFGGTMQRREVLCTFFVPNL